MELKQLYELARNIENEQATSYEEICQQVFDYAELGENEYQSSAYLAGQLEKLGFTVTIPYGGLETSFKAEYGNGHPKIAFLAEYDALPGYGPDRNQNGHACGHNWIAANTFGACAVLAAIKKQIGFQGTICYMGCAAEETIGGKVNMVEQGCFDDVDVAMQIHITGGSVSKLACQYLAIDSLEFSYYGKASHAAGKPEVGINALDACYLTFDGVNALRQHTKQDSRIHGIIVDGGSAPNIVPSYARSKWMVRAAEREYLTELTKRVIDCARGAAIMAGAKMEWRYYENSFDNMKLQPLLIEEFRQALETAGLDHIDTVPCGPDGSTDVGNVSWVCPTVMANLAVGNTDGSDCHEEPFLTYCTGDLGFKALHKAILGQVFLALKIYLDKELQNKLAEEKEKLMASRK